MVIAVSQASSLTSHARCRNTRWKRIYSDTVAVELAEGATDSVLSGKLLVRTAAGRGIGPCVA